MKPTGIVRAIDDLGRVVIPKNIRQIQGWSEGTLLEVFADNKGVLLQKYEPITSCVFCGEESTLVDAFSRKYVCSKCASRIIEAHHSNKPK